MKKYTLLVLIGMLPISLLAQQQWNLKDCIEYGLKNNRSSVVYANEKLAADAQAKEELADYLPKISVNGTLDNNLKLQESIIPGGIFRPEPIRVAFSQRFTSNGVVQLDQTIYDQSLLNGLKANKFNKQQADLNIKQNNETIIYNIGNAYYQIYVYREQLRLLKKNLETFQKQIDISKLQVNKGITLQKDLDKVTVNYNNAVSQLRVAESSLILAENQLKYNMGYPINSVLPIDTVSRKDITMPSVINVADSSFVAKKLTTYQLSEVNAQMLTIDQQRIKAGALPKLSGYARYGANGFGNSVSNALDVHSYSAIGLKLTIPLFDFFKRDAQYTQAKIKSLNASENLKLDEGKYRMEYENAKTKLVKAQANLDNDRRNIDLAESVFRTTDLQFKKGVTDLTDWLNAQNSIRESQNNYLNSLYSFYQTKLGLEKAGGTLNTFYTSL